LTGFSAFVVSSRLAASMYFMRGKIKSVIVQQPL